MARIARKLQKIFAINATNNGVFGSAQDGTKILSSDLAVLQSKPAWLTGWLDAVLGAKRFPALEEFQAVDYVTTSQLAYLFQEGLAEWEVGTTYYQNSIVKQTGTYKLYGSKTDNNTGNILTDTTNWQLLIDLSVGFGIPYGNATGAVNVYAVTTSPVFSAPTVGQLFFAKINITNTGAATINPNSFGAIPITNRGAALVGNEMTAGVYAAFIYDGTSAQLANAGTAFSTNAQTNAGTANNVAVTPASLAQRVATQVLAGISEIATTAELVTGTADDRTVSALGLTSLFNTRQILDVNGYQTLPGGLIVQWGQTASLGATDVSATVNFPLAFPNACLWAGATAQVANATSGCTGSVQSFTATTLTVARQYHNGLQDSGVVYWIAIGK